jgi:uncharacterized membrane protein HdeD (DUF308 family)
MLLLILGIVDVIAGIILTFFGLPIFPGNGIVLSLGILMLIKGIISYLMACANKFFFDVMGIMDILAGIFLLLLFYGIGLFFFPWLGILMVIKGIYSSVVWLSHAK